MSDLTIKEGPSQYPISDEGLHNAVMVDAVDLGNLQTPWGSKHKISLIFLLQSKDEDGKPFIVGKRFKRSLNEKASLRKFLKKIFVNIESVIPYKSQKTGEIAFFELKPSGDYTRVKGREGYQKPQENAGAVNNGKAA